ncbi:MerR family transcriptional regulator [Pseudonocardia yuanmonensis]|uniref:MerR family transcriptional regulator n=1 Tax=Pseudonocardia yuanmonensis TaxID=1095914 RepID=A0ABP8XLW3_9PSEU
MRIGELAERAGVSTRALRHYEALGLLPAQRRANGYRTYGEEDLRAVTEIRTLVGLGLSLEETRPFVECLRAGRPSGGSCADSIAVYRRKLAEVDASLARLGAVRAELEAQLHAALRERAPEPRCELTVEEA